MACAKIPHPPSQRIWTWMCQFSTWPFLFLFINMAWCQLTNHCHSHCKPSTVTNYKDLLLPGISHCEIQRWICWKIIIILHNRMVNTLETELSTKSQHKIMLLVTNAPQGLSTSQRIQFSTQKSELYFSTCMHFNQAIPW